MIQTVIVSGRNAINARITELATLRLKIFSEYPYLYDGSMESERPYLKCYIESPDSVIILAMEDDKIVGAVTGLPLACETSEFTKPFQDTGWQIDNIYYLGELLFYPEFRGNGLGSQLLTQMEHHVSTFKCFNRLTCATIVRPDMHPLKPKNHPPSDNFWIKHAFRKHPELIMSLPWQEINGKMESHELVFWVKN